MKNLLVVIFVFCATSILAQDKFGMRGLEWGMTYNEVLKNEKYNGASIVDYDEIEISRTYLGHGSDARILYSFDRDGLEEIRYIIYYPDNVAKGTCEKYLSFKERAQIASSYYYALTAKNFKCDMGWYNDISKHLAQKTDDRDDFWNCGFDSKTINLASDFLQKKNSLMLSNPSSIHIGLENEDSDVNFSFPIIYPRGTYEYEMRCNSDFYNTLVFITLEKN